MVKFEQWDIPWYPAEGRNRECYDLFLFLSDDHFEVIQGNL